MKTIPIYLKDQTYEVIVGEGAFREESASRIREFACPKEKIAIVSDENVWSLYGLDLLFALEAIGFDCFKTVIIPGEDTKTLQTLEWIFDKFTRERLGRDGLVVALGGGVVGDVAGFAAACWMRGVRYVHVPTTLLSMVDSTIGGKTAIDIPAGKNLVGAFHHPSLVIVDPGLLATLPENEFASGMAEIIKYGAALSKVMFNNIEVEKCEPSSLALTDVITDCIRLKAKIVAGDETDRGKRALLNFGYTFGRAIEAKYGYSRYSHGRAHALGMSLAVRYGEAAGVTIPGTAERFDSLLKTYGFECHESADGLYEYIKNDRQLAGDIVRLILLKEIGKAEIVETELPEIEEQLAEMAAL